MAATAFQDPKTNVLVVVMGEHEAVFALSPHHGNQLQIIEGDNDRGKRIVLNGHLANLANLPLSDAQLAGLSLMVPVTWCAPTTEQQLALAVLRGEKGSALVLADRVQEQWHKEPGVLAAEVGKAVMAEREACAKLLDTSHEDEFVNGYSRAYLEGLAATMRARGEKEGVRT